MKINSSLPAETAKADGPPATQDSLLALWAGGEVMIKTCECGQSFDEGARVSISVLGDIVLIKTTGHCVSCIEKYANRYSTPCVVCNRPILPGTPVGNGVVGKYGTGVAHLEGGKYDCATAATFAGTWGEGKAIPHPALVGR